MNERKEIDNYTWLEWEFFMPIKWEFEIYIENEIDWYDGWMKNDVLILSV